MNNILSIANDPKVTFKNLQCHWTSINYLKINHTPVSIPDPHKAANVHNETEAKKISVATNCIRMPANFSSSNQQEKVPSKVCCMEQLF